MAICHHDHLGVRLPVLCLLSLSMAAGSVRGDIDSQTEKLVRSHLRLLDDPRAEVRNRAKEDLLRMEVDILPFLEGLDDELSFETRAKVQEIIETLSDRGRGVVVSGWPGETPPEDFPIGTIIYRIDDQPVHHRKDYDRLSWHKSKKEFVYHLYDHHAGGKACTATTGPMYSLEIDDTVPAAREAHARAVSLAFDARYSESIGQFEKAMAAGLQIDRLFLTHMWYIYALYYTGHAEEARARLSRYAANEWMRGRDGPYQRMMDTFRSHAEKHQSYHPLQLFTRFEEEDLVASPGDIILNVDALYEQNERGNYVRSLDRPILLGQVLQNYPESIAEWLERMAVQTSENRSDRDRALANLFETLQIMHLESETLPIVQHFISNDRKSLIRGGLAELAVRLGETGVVQGYFERLSEKSGSDGFRKDLRSFYVRSHQTGATRAFLNARKAADWPFILLFPDYTYCHWADLHEDWLEGVFRAMSDPDFYKHQEIASHAALRGFEVILMQPDEVLDRIPQRVWDLFYEAEQKMHPKSSADRYRSEHAIRRAFLQGNYEDCLRRLREEHRDKPEKLEALPRYQAALFLQEHHARLATENSPWSRTDARYRFDDGSSLLVTRDMRMGLASANGEAIREVPIPDVLWSHEEIYVSPSGRTLITCVRPDRLYGLRADDLQWTLMMRDEGPPITSRLRYAAPLADQFYDYVGEHEAVDVLYAREIVPDHRSPHSADAAFFFVLRDGTFLDVHTKDRRLVNHNDVLRETLGGQFVIHNIWPMAREALPRYFFTDRGLILRNDDGAFHSLSLPDRTDNFPVTLISADATEIHFALLPHLGHQCYRIDEKTNVIEPTNLRNHGYPITYWLARSADENQEAVREAVTAAGYDWPIDFSYRPEQEGASESGPAAPEDPKVKEEEATATSAP